jgi:AraC-like DNA-binding protein
MEESSEQKSFLYVWSGLAFFYSLSHSNTSHTHYAASIIHSFEKPFELEFANGEKKNLYSIFIPSNYKHRLNSKSPLLVIQVDPDSPEYNPLRKYSPDKPLELDRKIPSVLEKDILSSQNCNTAKDLIRKIINLAGDNLDSSLNLKSSIDYRVKNVVKYLQALEELPPKISLQKLASIANLSPDRFRHLFAEEMGLSVRRYLLWLRIRKTGTVLQKGFSLTDAAHDAGFTDSAHFSKTFKQNFGVSPSFILTNSNVKIKFCDLNQ